MVAFLSGVTGNIAVSADVKPIVGHNVANLLVNAVAHDEAEVSCYFSVVTHVLVPDGETWRINNRNVSTDWAAPDSVMAQPSR